MKKKVIYELESLHRSNMHINAYEFGEGKESLCIVGSLRGNEVQQTYICSLLVEKLKKYEAEGKLAPGHKITVIPCANTFSLNQDKRFWPQDDTDINRMFPGYYEGETTQRIADVIFSNIKDYEYGVQFTSFYIPGEFSTHIRIMETELNYLEDGKLFGLPYVMVRQPRPYDTTTLNYNWQIWNCKAFSMYTKACESIDNPTAKEACRSVLRFMSAKGILKAAIPGGYQSEIVSEDSVHLVKCSQAGFMRRLVTIDAEVSKGDVVAEIYDPYEHTVLERLTAPCDGIVFFAHSKSLVYAHTAIVKIKAQDD